MQQTNKKINVFCSPNLTDTKPIKFFLQDKIFPPILGVLSSDNSKNVSEICWAIQLSQEIWHCHTNLEHFIGPSPNLFELAIDRVLTIESRSDELESSFRDLSSSLASHLTEAHTLWIENLTRALLDRDLNRNPSFEILQTLLCSLKSEILSRLNPELVSSLFSTQSTVFNELPIFKIRYCQIKLSSCVP